MILHDFDKEFEAHLKDWMVKKADDFENMDEMEMALPDEYANWLSSPKDWLDGTSPGEYFDQFDDGEYLVEYLLKYMVTTIGVPDPLMDRIVDIGQPCIEPLMKLLSGELGLPAGVNDNEARITAINLLNQLQSDKPIDLYIDIIATENEEGLCDAALESLNNIENVADKVLIAMAGNCSEEGRERFADVLVNYPNDKRILNWLIQLFKESDNVALFSSYLGKYGDRDALPTLKKALLDKDINYLDYTEIKNAMEELGEVIEIDRDFSGDKYYEALRGNHK